MFPYTFPYAHAHAHKVFKANKSGEISTHKAAKHIGQLRKMLVGDESATNTVSGKEESGQKTGEAAKGQLLGNGARGKGNADASTRYVLPWWALALRFFKKAVTSS